MEESATFRETKGGRDSLSAWGRGRQKVRKSLRLKCGKKEETRKPTWSERDLFLRDSRRGGGWKGIREKLLKCAGTAMGRAKMGSWRN